jgi:hypothetical protein
MEHEKMIRYEYRVLIQSKGFFSKLLDDSKKVAAQLNEYGSQGWKLVGEHEGDKYMRWIFIREVQ